MIAFHLMGKLRSVCGSNITLEVGRSNTIANSNNIYRSSSSMPATTGGSLVIGTLMPSPSVQKTIKAPRKY